MTELCAERGYEETSAAQIAERAGVSPATFEKIFAGGKEECMVGAVDASVAEIFTAVSSSYSADRSEWESGIRGIKAILELLAARPSLAHLGCIGSRQMGPPRAREAHDAGVRLLAAMIDRLREGAATQAPPSAARAAFGAANAVARREIAAGRAEQLPRFLPEFVYSATVPFLGRTEALRLGRQARGLLAGSEWA
jgi:AcrR family transcriptional regulator